MLIGVRFPYALPKIMERYTVVGSGADCKSVVFNGSGGSTPSRSTSFNFLRIEHIINHIGEL